MFQISVPSEFKSIVKRRAVSLGGSLQNMRTSDTGTLSATVSLSPDALSEFREWYEHFDFNSKHYKFCSFCGKEQSEVSRLIAAPEEGVFICNECVVSCGELITE